MMKAIIIIFKIKRMLWKATEKVIKFVQSIIENINQTISYKIQKDI